jgi:hypothetical protein
VRSGSQAEQLSWRGTGGGTFQDRGSYVEYTEGMFSKSVWYDRR